MNINEYRGTCPRKSRYLRNRSTGQRSANFRTIRATLSGVNGAAYTKRGVEAISRNQLAVAVVIARLRAPWYGILQFVHTVLDTLATWPWTACNFGRVNIAAKLRGRRVYSLPVALYYDRRGYSCQRARIKLSRKEYIYIAAFQKKKIPIFVQFNYFPCTRWSQFLSRDKKLRSISILQMEYLTSKRLHTTPEQPKFYNFNYIIYILYKIDRLKSQFYSIISCTHLIKNLKIL